MMMMVFVVAAQTPTEPKFGGALHIPYLSTPTSIAGKEIPTKAANPWTVQSALTGTGDLMSKLKNMYAAPQAEGGNIDLEKQAAYISEINTLTDEVAKEAAATQAAKDAQKANEDGIIAEGDALYAAHTQETAQASLYNAAAYNANQILLSDHAWLQSLGQAGKVESFIAGDENNVISVLDGGEAVLKAASTQLEELDTEVHARADELQENCMNSLFGWNFNATTQVNDQTHSLADLLQRSGRMKEDFTEAHSKIVEMIQVLASEQKEVSGTHAAAAEEEPKAALLQIRAKAVLETAHDDHARLLKGASFEQVGFWRKLTVLKDLFENKFKDETLPPIEAIAKKFHDA